MIIVAFVLSLGPYLYLSRLSLNIPLPDLLLRQILPGADSIRSWGRFSLIVTLGVCLLAGAGCWSPCTRPSARRCDAGGM
ncbi:MAG: hypothetical protein U0521_17265 [Anaerolineae bacterium]